MSLTTKELGFIEDAIKVETLCAKKLEVFRRDVREPELERLVEDCIESCHRNVDMLLRETR
ncbi:MAG TPA: hypothetical protein VNM16_10895 [Bacillota bacterium]|nr:hypothetical protein [Bacillota bacterium]